MRFGDFHSGQTVYDRSLFVLAAYVAGFPLEKQGVSTASGKCQPMLLCHRWFTVIAFTTFASVSTHIYAFSQEDRLSVTYTILCQITPLLQRVRYSPKALHVTVSASRILNIPLP